MFKKVLSLALVAMWARAAPQHEHGYYPGHELELHAAAAPAHSYASFSVPHEASQPALHTVAIAAPVTKYAVAPAVAKVALAPAVAKLAVEHGASSYSSLSFGHSEAAHQVQYAAAAPILQKYTEVHAAPAYQHVEAAPAYQHVEAAPLLHSVHAAPAVQYAAAVPVVQKYTQVHAAPAYQHVEAAPAYQHVEIAPAYHLQPVVHAAPAAPLVKTVETHVEQYSHPKYEFSYGVKDAHTGDMKSQHEVRDGDAVKGYYTLHEADGTTRTVHYTADKHSGFNAVVERTGHAQHPQVQHVAKALVAAPAPVLAKQLVALHPDLHQHYEYAPHH